MASPIELIKSGIVSNNWSLVCQGYEALTGEFVKATEIFEEANVLITEIEKIINKHKKIITLNPEGHTYVSKDKNKKSVEKYKTPPLVDTNIIKKSGYYGNETKPLTEDVPQEEIDENIKKAEIAKERKTKRSPPKKYPVKCSQCKQTFESDRRESKGFGQKCPKCLQDTINGKVNE